MHEWKTLKRENDVKRNDAYRFVFGWGRANSVADIGGGKATIGHGAAIKLLFAPITAAAAAAAAALLLLYGCAPVAYNLLGPKWFSTADNIGQAIITHLPQ